MGTFNIYIFLIHCFVPSIIDVGENVRVVPFEGIGNQDVADLMDAFLGKVLEQPPQPRIQKNRMVENIRENGASAIVEISDIVANNEKEAIKSSEETLMIVRDILAFRQYQRGIISGFVSIQTDTSPVKLYSSLKPPALIQKIYNIPIFESEGEIQTHIYQRAKKDPKLRVYLSLFADTVAFSDTLISNIGLETQLLKTWALLEVLAIKEKGTKKEKVKALFRRYRIDTYPNFHNSDGKDLIDIAYKWRNIIAHCGGCDTAVTTNDMQFCQNFSPHFREILKYLRDSCQAFISKYSYSLSD